MSKLNQTPNIKSDFKKKIVYITVLKSKTNHMYNLIIINEYLSLSNKHN